MRIATLCFLLFLIVSIIPAWCYSQNKKDSTIVVYKILLTGNKKTKPQIIHREIVFKEGDTLQANEINKKLELSKKNLLNTSLFNFVNFSYYSTDSLHYTFICELTERWYTWPNPIFEISDRNFNSWWETKDFNRINYGMYIQQQNFRGRKETLKLLCRLGYDERYTLDYSIPFINKKQKIGIGIRTGVKRNHEIAYTTVNNKLEHIKSQDSYLYWQNFAALNIVYRPQIYKSHSVHVSYEYNKFGDTVLKLNPEFSHLSRLKDSYFTLHYQYKDDHRDIKAYPLEGYYFQTTLSKLGLDFWNKDKLNLLFASATLNKYWKLSNRFYAANGISGKYSVESKQPYYILQGLGYGNDFVRGYEYYVIDGEHFFISKNVFKFTLLPTKEFQLKFIPTEKFNKIHFASYLNLNLDFAYVSNTYYKQYNNLTNTWLSGGGIGLDLVTYYDKVIRIEYSINKMKETGVFLHFIAPI